MASFFPTTSDYDESLDVKYPALQKSNDFSDDSFYPPPQQYYNGEFATSTLLLHKFF